MGLADSSVWTKYVGILIIAIVGFTLFAALYPEASTAGDSMNASNMCSDAGCFYNGSRATGVCTVNNATPQDTTICAGAGQGAAVPLSGLFAGGGVLFLIISAGILLYYLRKNK